jgi:hypothetical protein
MRVHVYWNLNRDIYSIRAAEGEHRGRVIDYASDVSLTNASFVVREAGRRRVLKNKRKEVHAWIAGNRTGRVSTADLEGVTYDPYRHETFVRRRNGEAVHAAGRVRCLMADGKANVLAGDFF